MNSILYLTYPLSALAILSLALGTGVLLTRGFRLGWRLYWIGAATFIASQALHIPFNLGLGALIASGRLPIPPAAWRLVFNALVLGLSAGLFEELARYATYRWWAREARSWGRGLLLGAGHAGIEAVLTAGLILWAYLNMLALRGGSLPGGLSPEQAGQLQAQVQAYWSVVWYDSLLGAAERLMVLPVHLALSILVLQVFTRRQDFQRRQVFRLRQVLRPSQGGWLLLAIGWHTLLDAAAVFFAGSAGIYAAEAAIAVIAVLSLAILLALRRPEPAALPAAAVSLPPALPAETALAGLPSLEETTERLDQTRYAG